MMTGVTPLLNDNDGFEELVEEGKENKWNMMFPLITLIGGAFIGLLVTGGGNLAAGDGTTAILYSVVITLLIMCVMYTKQGIMTAKEFGDSVMKGVSSMMGLVILLVLSFSIGGVIKGMGTGQFLASLLGDSIDGAFCPAIIFLMGALMAFCTGTSWGTFSIMMPIAVPMAVAMNGNILLTIGAVVSGGIFGDHCSPPFRYHDPVLHVRRHRSVFSRKNAAPLRAGNCGVHSGPLYRLWPDSVTAGCFRITVLDR